MIEIDLNKTAAATYVQRGARFHRFPLMPRILRAIRNSPDKRITFAQFMQMCLYDRDYGFYSKGNARIANFDEMCAKNIGSGDIHFTTNPEWYYPHYGYAIAEALLSMWRSMDCPQSFSVIEMGAGKAGMAKGILDYLKINYPHFYSKVKYTIIEISPYFARQQLSRLSEHAVNIVNASALDFPLNNIRGAIVSNELPDIFPLHRIIYNQDNRQIKEIFVTEIEGELKEVAGPVSDKRVFEYLDRIFKILKKPRNGSRRVVNLGMMNWLRNLSRSLEQGYILTLDYCINFSEEKTIEPVRIFNRDINLVNQPHGLGSLYASPGNFDITASVHSDVYCSIADEEGLDPVFVGAEAEFIRSAGGIWPNKQRSFFALLHSKNITTSFQNQNTKVIVLDRYFIQQRLFYPVLEEFLTLSAGKKLAQQMGKSGNDSRREVIMWLSRKLRALFSSPVEKVFDFSNAEAKLSRSFPRLDSAARKRLADLLKQLPQDLPADFSTPTFRADWFERKFGF
jgi:SAM-dependent MidA family methyltransferase